MNPTPEQAPVSTMTGAEVLAWWQLARDGSLYRLLQLPDGGQSYRHELARRVHRMELGR